MKESALFNHPNIIPLLGHSIISIKAPEATWSQEAYLLFPFYKYGTVLDHLTRMQERKNYFPTITVLHIFQQVGFVDQTQSGNAVKYGKRTQLLVDSYQVA